MRTRLSGVAKIFAHHPARRLRIVGHADPAGPAVYNLALSRRRAEAVADALVELGATRSQFDIESVGSTDPESRRSRAESRRVELDWIQ
ncbi:MAG: OmpA family protein [Deltaproteobacteria bacterium]|nr:OmpA family protein [Deltaproteobacteria bacterium]